MGLCTFYYGVMYDFGSGVAKDDRLALVSDQIRSS